MVKITAIHMVGSEHHQHIAEMQWINPETGATGTSSREAMVEFVRNNPGQAYVQGPTERAFLRVREATPPYVQTVADNTWTDNLLALPRY
jgi:hypothetical protein